MPKKRRPVANAHAEDNKSNALENSHLIICSCSSTRVMVLFYSCFRSMLCGHRDTEAAVASPSPQLLRSLFSCDGHGSPFVIHRHFFSSFLFRAGSPSSDPLLCHELPTMPATKAMPRIWKLKPFFTKICNERQKYTLGNSAHTLQIIVQSLNSVWRS